MCIRDRDLGVHTEMYVDAFVDIAKAGKITGANKNIDRYRQTYAFAAGTKKLYDYLNDNPACMSAPVDYTNSIATISSIANFISINNAVDIDLYGQISAESVSYTHLLLILYHIPPILKQADTTYFCDISLSSHILSNFIYNSSRMPHILFPLHRYRTYL